MIVMVVLFSTVVVGACAVAVAAALGFRRIMVLRSSCSALISHMEFVLGDPEIVGGLIRAGYRDDVRHALKLAREACNAQERMIAQLLAVRPDDLAEASAYAESAWTEWMKIYDEAFVLGLVPGRWEDGAAWWEDNAPY